jgi:RHS repeat-associated protein
MNKRLTISLGLSLGLMFVVSLALASASGGEFIKMASDARARKPLAVDPGKNRRQIDIPDLKTPRLLAGQTATLLPDGRWLLIGGESKEGGPRSAAVIVDPHTNASSPLPVDLNRPRAWHSATMLPNGHIIIIGGIGGGGQIVKDVEVFNPGTQKFESLAETGITARAYHTATLLTDGRMLLAGGISSRGRVSGRIELWNPLTGTSSALPFDLQSPRRKHTATLLANGSVLFWGGVDKYDHKLDSGEALDPDTQNIMQIGFSSRGEEAGAPYLMASSPREGETSVPADARIALRFSKLLSVETVNSQTMTLTGSQGAVPASIIPAENGRLVFITPSEQLRPGATYTLSLNGASDRANLQLAPSSITFTTAGSTDDHSEHKHETATDQQETGNNMPLDDDSWVPDTKNLQGDWRSRRADSPARSLPALKAAPGETALAGQVLGLSGRPVANVTLQIEDRTAVTDQTGRFLLTSLKPGQPGLVIRGDTASRPGKTYGTFETRVDVDSGKTNVLPYTIWLTVLDQRNAVRLSTPAVREQVVTTPSVPGMEVRVPQGSVLRMPHGHGMDMRHGSTDRLLNSLTITPIPLDRAPFSLPPGAKEGLLFTLQMHGAKVEGPNGEKRPGLRIIFPNILGLPKGSRVGLYNYDSTGVGWYLYGQGTVTPDGRQVVPDPGVELNSMHCISYMGGLFVPLLWPFMGNPTDADPVDLGTGLFIYNKTDLYLPDVMPISLTRTYRQNDEADRAFGIGATHPYDMYIVGDTNTFGEMILPDGGRIRFNATGNATCPSSSCIYEHTATQSPFYKATLKQVDSPAPGYTAGWDVKLLDGTIYHFYRASWGDALITHSATGLHSIEDRFGNRIVIERDGLRRAIKITSPNGRWIKLSYDGESKRIAQAKDNIGRTVAYQYHPGGELWKVTDPNEGVTEYTYESPSRMKTIKDARSIVYLTNEYDVNGRIKKQIQADGTTFQFAYTLDAQNNITQTEVTDPRSHVRRATFNASGYWLTDTAAVGQSEQHTVTVEREPGTNFIKSEVNALGQKSAFTYTASGKLETVTSLVGTPAAATTSFTYEPVYQQVATVTDALSHTITFNYSNGLLQSVTDPLSHQTSYTLNSAGQVTAVTDALQHTTRFEYDAGDLVKVTDPLNRSVTRFVDGAGRVASMTDALGRVTRYQYDALNQPKKVINPLQGETLFAYDKNGNTESITDARMKVTRYTYDEMDRVKTRTDPMLKVETYDYEAGLLKKFTDRRGKVTRYGYDNLDRTNFVGFGETINGGVTTYESTMSHTYDALSRLKQVVDSASGTITRNYDDIARSMSEVTAQGTLSYSYDAAGRLASKTVSGQSVINYSYDNASRLLAMTQGAASVSFDYDEVNRRKRLTMPNGVMVDYEFDEASQLKGIKYRRGATQLGDLSYGYDAAGQRIKMGGSYARTLLPQSLTTATYNDANHLTQRGAATLTYDDAGNLTSDGVNTYTWNARNQLSAISGSVNASFQYDAFGRRRAKTINGQTTHHLYDGANVAQEQQSGGAALANMLNGGVDEVLSRTDSAGTWSPLRDGLGSTLALSDMSGAAQISYTYDPFGTTSSTGSASSNSSQYTGRENDGTGLYYYRARYYSPILQRFISEDPLEFEGSPDLNLYSYALNNPVNFIDPDGGSPTLVTGAVGAGVGGLIGGVRALANGESWADIGKATAVGVVAGGVTGLTLGAAGPAIAGWAGGGWAGGALSGAVASGAGNTAGQGVSIMVGRQCQLQGEQLGQAVVLGGVGGAFAFRPSTAANQKVASWAELGTKPDLTPGRWVMTGGGSTRNWLMSGIFQKYPSGNYTTGTLPASSLSYPSGWESFKGVFGQRIVK